MLLTKNYKTSHYKSWSGLNKWLNEMLCDKFNGRIKYFFTRYHEAHNSYGRASILLDNTEMACFSWNEMYNQEHEISDIHRENRNLSYEEIKETLKTKWDENGTYYEKDFLDAVLTFRNMSIQEALKSDNYIIKILAIMDKRVGERTLKKIAEEREYQNFPSWVKQFYELRLK